MPVRAKGPRSTTARRRTVAVAPKTAAHGRPRPRVHRAIEPVAHPHHAASPSPYTKALRFLASLSDYERMRIVRYNSQNFDLDRMRTLLRKLGNPQERFRSVHVAGTKGKGSTCAMTAAMLEGNGYKVGL